MTKLLTNCGLIDGFKLFLMGRLHKNIQLILEFLKGPFLVLHFSYDTLMTFLLILSVILVSMWIVLLSTLNLIMHLICGNNQDWLLNLNLIYEMLWTEAGSGLLISVLEKLLNSFCLTSLITVAIDVKLDGSVLEEKSAFKMLGKTSCSNQIWAFTLSLLLKLPPRKLES